MAGAFADKSVSAEIASWHPYGKILGCRFSAMPARPAIGEKLAGGAVPVHPMRVSAFPAPDVSGDLHLLRICFCLFFRRFLYPKCDFAFLVEWQRSHCANGGFGRMDDQTGLTVVIRSGLDQCPYQNGRGNGGLVGSFGGAFLHVNVNAYNLAVGLSMGIDRK